MKLQILVEEGFAVFFCNIFISIRSCFKFIPRQIETYVEADWSPRYVVNSGLLTTYQGIQDARQGLNMAGTYLPAMIILFLYKFKTASKSTWLSQSSETTLRFDSQTKTSRKLTKTKKIL